MPNFLQAKLREGKGDILSHIVKVKIVKINGMVKIPEMKNVFFSHQNVPVCCHGSLKDQEQTLAEESNLFVFFPYIKKSAEKKPFGGTGKGRMFGHNTMLCRPHKRRINHLISIFLAQTPCEELPCNHHRMTRSEFLKNPKEIIKGHVKG